MASPIRIVCAANDKYARHLAVMLSSLLQNKSPKAAIRIYVIDGGGLSARNKQRLRVAAKAWGAPVAFIRFDNAKLRGLNRANITKRYGKEAMYRIFIPELFGSGVKRALYLDCDLIVKKDISRLWRMPLRGRLAAAAIDPSDAKMSRRLGLPRGSYFNSGVLLINVAGWRKHRVADRVIRYMQKRGSRLRFPDQDALNVVLNGKTRLLPMEWNCPAFRSHLHPSHAILHFMTPNKPWLPRGNPQGKQQYAKYLERTIWIHSIALRRQLRENLPVARAVSSAAAKTKAKISRA